MVASNPTIPIITLNTNKLKLHLKEIGRKQNPALCFLQETDCFFGCAAQYVGTQFSDPGSNLCPLHWKCGVLTTGLPGKPPHFKHEDTDMSKVNE